MPGRKWLCLCGLGLLLAICLPVAAQRAKEPLHQLDGLAFQRPELRVAETPADAEALKDAVSNLADLDAFRAEHGMEWRIVLDERRGVPTLVDGGAIPFIPGHANSMRWSEAAPGCSDNTCIPPGQVERLAREFLAKHRGVFKAEDQDLILDPAGTGPIGASIYLLRFQWSHGGVPVERGSVFFRINGGNLLQVATENVGPISLDPVPSLSVETAWETLRGFLGPYAGGPDRVVDPGSLLIVPATPRGRDPETFSGAVGSMIDYRLAYRLSFVREGVIGTWEALVDAHTGEILRFADATDYGRVHGGVYINDGRPPEADRPFPFADIGGGLYSDAGGLFTGNSGTSTLTGKYTYIVDSCGSIANATTAGDIDFLSGSGTDCSTPASNPAGPGNTHASRTLFYHLTAINIKARTYMPSNSWLNDSHITAYVNQSPYCNAGSSGSSVNFYRASSPCTNLAEVPAIALHEWGHSLDNYDGSGGASPPKETRADWTATLQTHMSCSGDGAFTDGNCGGYGNSCTDCTGVRDADRTKHSNTNPWTIANYNSVWGTGSQCNSGYYYGPCGKEDHCESGISTQALWEFVTYDLTHAPTNMDLTTAWQLEDRLFYAGMPSMGNMYACSGSSSDGCNGSGLYAVMRALDDSGDGTGNGTPHAAAIYSALARHNIACGSASDATNQNQSSCLALTATTLTASPGNNAASLSWDAVTNATRYFVYRNENECDFGYTKVGTETDTDFTDNTVVNGLTYFYRIQAATASDACVSPMSNCAEVVPQNCATPATPTGVSAAPVGDNQVRVQWTPGSPGGSKFTIYRSVSTCAGATTFDILAQDVPASPYVDTAVDGGKTYAYKVQALDTAGACPSGQSACAQAVATGECRSAPAFSGLASVTNPSSATCTLNLSWGAGSAACAGPLTYSVYRSTTSPFTPSAGNRIASGVTGTTYSDGASLTSGVTYHYLVRAVDASNAMEETNAAERSGVPTGPVTSATAFTESFEGAAPPDLPAGWAVVDVTGTSGNWVSASSTVNPAGGTPHGGSVLACFNAFTATASNKSRLYRTSGLSLAGASGAELAFWMYHDTANTSKRDRLVPQVSTDGGGTWATLGAAINRNDGTTGWKLHTADLSSAAGQADVRIAFLGEAQKGNDIHIDDVTVTKLTTGACATGGATTPKEANPAGNMTCAAGAGNSVGVTFVGGCGTTDHAIYWSKTSAGALAGLAWQNAACGLGTGGSATFDTGALGAGEWVYFVVVGQNATKEGSYGRDSSGVERPEATGVGTCDKPQDLTGTCP